MFYNYPGQWKKTFLEKIRCEEGVLKKKKKKKKWKKLFRDNGLKKQGKFNIKL